MAQNCLLDTLRGQKTQTKKSSCVAQEADNMALADNKYYEGIFVNPNAIDLRTKKYLAKLVRNVLKKAGEMSLAPQLFVNNPLDAKMGTEGKLYDWGQLVARLKPDGVPSGLQKVLASSTSYSLDEYEVKTGITDRAKINSQMSAQNILSEGDAARAFKRAFDAQAFNLCKSGMNTTSGTDWSSATDAQVMAEIDTMIGEIDDGQFDPNAMVITRKQRSRIAKVGLSYANPLTAEQLISKTWPDIKKVFVWKKITIEKPDGSTETLFDPTGYAFAIQTDACGVYTQRPTTVETKRDVDAGLDLAYLRKYFKTDLVQLNASHMLDSLVI